MTTIYQLMDVNEFRQNRGVISSNHARLEFIKQIMEEEYPDTGWEVHPTTDCPKYCSSVSPSIRLFLYSAELQEKVMAYEALRRETFGRQLRTNIVHFKKYGKLLKIAPSTRTLECSFETDWEFSDAMAASLMLKAQNSPDLKAGLTAWNVYTSDSWIESQERHQGRTLQEIEATL